MATVRESCAFGLLTVVSALACAGSSDSGEPEATGDAGATSGTTTTAMSGSTSSTTGATTTAGSTGAGVLIDGTCALLCMDDSSDADSEGVTDGWGFEMGTSCVVPGSMADTGMACDNPVLAVPPDDPSTPGTGVLVSGTCMRVCDDDSTDDDGSGSLDGWGWEHNASCIVPGGVADPGVGEVCTDFEMPVTSDPGGTVDVDGTCFPVCLDDSTDDDGTGATDGWGYDETAMESCVVPGGVADTGTACSS